jgi:hypothetical protein
LIRDGSLWKKIDLRQYKSDISLTNLKKIASVYANDSTKQLFLLGNYAEDGAKTQELVEPSNRPLYYLDTHFFDEILLPKANNLTHINLEYLDLIQLNFSMIIQLPNLEHLSLTWCNLDPDWFQDQNPTLVQTTLPRLQHLYLIRSGNLCSKDIERICKIAPDLKTLIVNQSKAIFMLSFIFYAIF